MPGDASWYQPICDDVLRKVYRWLCYYHRGDVSASRKWMGMDGRIVDRITKHANVVRFTPTELDHLVRILDALATTRELVDYFRTVRKGIRRGKLMPGGEYEVVLNAYKQDVEETLTVLIRAKTGRTTNLADVAKEQIAAGKPPFAL